MLFFFYFFSHLFVTYHLLFYTIFILRGSEMFGVNHFLGENDIIDSRSSLGMYLRTYKCCFCYSHCFSLSSFLLFSSTSLLRQLLISFISFSTSSFFLCLLSIFFILSYFLSFPHPRFLYICSSNISISISVSLGAIGSGDRIFHPFGNYETSLGKG